MINKVVVWLRNAERY